MSPQELARVPAKRGVLALLAGGGEPILLLTAADMRSRLRNRLTAPDAEARTRSADLRAVTRRVAYKLTHSHFETDLYYLRIARAIWPDRYASMVAWKPAWFVHVDVADKAPHFVRTREVGARGGHYIGPFASGRDAERFVGMVVEAFDLCRDVRCLRQAPNAQPCAYAQMRRCASPCDGTISMEAYASMVTDALAFAQGHRDALRQSLQRQMRAAAEGLEFEWAAALKTRLDRLAELDASSFAHAVPLEQFCFMIVQCGGSVRRAPAFVACVGAVSPAGVLDYPLKAQQLDAVVKQAAGEKGQAGPVGRFERLCIGLVARYVFSSPQRRGLIVRWTPAMTADDLAREIEHAAGVLNLRAPKPRKAKPADRPDGSSGNEPGDLPGAGAAS